MPSAGMGRRLLAGGDVVFDQDLMPAIRRSESRMPAVVNDYWWPGGVAARPVEIPVCWLTPPFSLRLERPYTHAEVTQLDGLTARQDSGSATVYPFVATLTSPVDADAQNLAHWTVTFQSRARMRSPNLVIDLLYRSDEEKRLLLGVKRNQRIRLTDLPDEWPAGADTLVVRGIQHQVTTYSRRLTWITGPVIGAFAGVPGPWFRWSTSSWGGTDIRAF